MESLSRPSQAQHKSKYLASVNGRFLFTAPHSGKLQRGGAEYGEKRRVHLREKYTNSLALKFALEVSKQTKSGDIGSFCIWSKEHKLNDTDLDPNYLQTSNLSESPFHQVLHQFCVANGDNPMFHVDIHGKMDRKDCYDLDLGVQCLFKHWNNEEFFVQALSQRLVAEFNKILKTIPTHLSFTAVANPEPYLNGNWGGDLYTMNEQAVMMGIPSIQLEIPLKMRAYLFNNEAFMKQFVGVIVTCYNEIIVNWWPARVVPLLYDPQTAARVETKKLTKKELETINTAYIEWEKKQTAEKKYCYNRFCLLIKHQLFQSMRGKQTCCDEKYCIIFQQCNTYEQRSIQHTVYNLYKHYHLQAVSIFISNIGIKLYELSSSAQIIVYRLA